MTKKLLIVIGLVLFIPIFFIPFGGPDGDVYLYMGRLILDGKVPYIDGWDHKGISLYFLNAFGYGVLGANSVFGIRLLEFLLILFSFSRLYNYIVTHYSKTIAFISTLIGLLTLKYFFDGGNLTEEYATCFSILSVLLLLKDKPKTIDYAIVGAFFILNLTIRANLIGLWIAIFLALAFQLIRKDKSFKEVLFAFLKMSYGAFSIIALLSVYLFSTNSFYEFIDAAFTFNFSYSSGNSSTTVFETIIRSLVRYRFSLVIIGGLLISFYKIVKKKSSFIHILLLFWIPIELYLSNVSQKMFAHYYLTWIPLVVFSIILIYNFIETKLHKMNLKYVYGILLIYIATCFYSPLISTKNHWMYAIDDKQGRDQDITTYFRDNYKTDSFLVWGNSSFVYNKLNVFTSNTFFYHSIFKIESEVIQEKTKIFTEQIKSQKPIYILDTKRNGMLHLDYSNENEISPYQKGILKDFIAFVNDNYVLVESKFGTDFYKKTDD